ncbi:hypothetical protein Mal64_28000 [Pseudobythopirellula maris]|uniref:SHOCT domain-containing protein n=1 Tax=Pseudobythopirellula maris TaxID=2527991 RepID=A0A5C5ZIP3_9BACT|nr:SHOCT domain-containing protein [Pseudobythopirellula maris]TWT87262.1 hypothetical protein Mal64_28000 [Pseudobythopirellula maris]
MTQLTQAGQNLVNDLSNRYGFSPDAVTTMLQAVVNGRGTMAQFSHPEFGGSGQWMQGGMTMIGDMFNNGLKNSVVNLCGEISQVLANEPGLFATGGSFQSQSQGNSNQGSSYQDQGTGAPMGPSSLFKPDPRQQWYPQDLGPPSATGAQNNVRYAYFANARRLAVDSGGDVWVYDTLDHQIGGFSQQQGSGGSITFSSQYGTVNLSSLPVVMRGGQPVAPQQAPAPAPAASYSYSDPAPPAPAPADGGSGGGDVFGALERLGDLKSKGILSDEEFASKKAELLERL